MTTGSTAAATGTTGDATTGSTPDWTTGLDADAIGFIQTKGFKAPGDLLGSYRNLEKLLGAGPDKLVKLPTDDKPESWDPVYQKLGRPAKPEEYEIQFPEALKDATAFQETLRKTMHGLGLSAKQGRELAKALGETIVTGMTAEQQAEEQARQAETQQQQAALKTKWGANYDANVNAARGALRAFGVTADDVDKVESVLGYARTMELFHGIGSRLGEAPFTEGGQPPGGFGMSGDQARAEITRLRQDVGFAQKLVANDAEAKAKWDRLHRIAYPDAA